MADIFISYSSYNREKASALVKELRSAGHDVWMDQGGIGGAMDWSSEIVEALNKAKTVLFLISKDSVTSHNCAKEIHLANEKHKNILPVVIEDTPLPVLFEYPLAGLQRVPYERTDAILHALEVLKGGKSVLEAMLTQSKIDDGVVRLAVLPFEDQSPSQDNEWFANGMMDELIDTLGSLSNMKVNPRGDVIYYKKNRPKLEEIVQDLKVRYIVEGAVQKAGEKIRIKVSLTDCKIHEQIWHQKYDGTFDDIFDLQDKTCYSIADAIKLTLTPEDKQKIDKKPTENAEAYELYLKASDYFEKSTRDDFERALLLFQSANELDPQFAVVYAAFANTHLEIYYKYDRHESHLEVALISANKLYELNGETALYCWVMSGINRRKGDAPTALTYAKRSVEIDPNCVVGYDALAFACQITGDKDAEISAREEVIRLRENGTNARFNLLIALDGLGDVNRLRLAAQKAVHVFERHLRLSPDDYNAKVQLASVHYFSGDRTSALELADMLSNLESLDGVALYNLACIYCSYCEVEHAFSRLRDAIRKGYVNPNSYRYDTILDPLRGTPEFEELMRELEEKITKTTNG